MATAAFLNNHNTAAPFVVKMLADLGVDTYIPSRCAESGACAGDAAKALRTSRLSTEVCECLDEIDFYADTRTIDMAHVDVLNASFDLVVIPGATRTPNLLFLAETLAVPVVIYEWGDINGITMHREYHKASSRANVRVAVAYSDFDRTLLHLPLGFAECPSGAAIQSGRDQCGVQTNAGHTVPTIVTIASRLTGPHGYTHNHLKRALKMIRATHARLLVLGKHHVDTRFLKSFWFKWKSIERRSDLSRADLLQELRSAAAFLYWMREPAVLQYVALESAALGTPVIYWADTLLSRYMPVVDQCRLSGSLNLRRLLAELADENARRTIAAKQWECLQSLTIDARLKWSRMLESCQAGKKTSIEAPT